MNKALHVVAMFLIITKPNGMDYPWPFRLKVSIETFLDIEVPGETVRGRFPSVTATQAVFEPYGSFIVWFARLIGVGSVPSLGSFPNKQNKPSRLGGGLSPPFI